MQTSLKTSRFGRNKRNYSVCDAVIPTFIREQNKIEGKVKPYHLGTVKLSNEIEIVT